MLQVEIELGLPLSRRAGLIVGQRRERHPQQSHGSFKGIDGCQKSGCRVEHISHACERHRGGPTARHLGEIRVFDLHGYGLAADPLRLAIAPNLLGKRLQLSRCAFQTIDILDECVFRADGFADAIRPDLAFVDATGDAIEIRAGLPKCSCRKASDFDFRWSPVSIPYSRMRSAVAGPTPWNFLTGRVSTKPGPFFGVMTAWPREACCTKCRPRR